jgi:preprotein translocase subunit SecG
MQTVIYTLHFIVCFVLIAVVLLQRGKGADLGASLGGGGANTVFGSRGAGNFLTKITTASAITFMATSLTLSYYGYQASDLSLFGPNGAAIETEGLEEVPSALSEDSGGLVEIPNPTTGDPAPNASPKP